MDGEWEPPKLSKCHVMSTVHVASFQVLNTEVQACFNVLHDPQVLCIPLGMYTISPAVSADVFLSSNLPQNYI